MSIRSHPLGAGRPCGWMAVLAAFNPRARYRAGLKFCPTAFIVIPRAAIDVKSEYFMEYSRCAANRCHTTWAFHTVCLYARFFFGPSITIMATVWVFFPSELVGETAIGSGEHFLPYRFQQQQIRAIHSIFSGLVFCAPHLLNAALPPSAPAKHWQFPGPLARQVRDG